jgi:hypothetical protein
MPNTLLNADKVTDELNQQLTNGGYDVENSPFAAGLVTPFNEVVEDIVNQVRSYYNRSVLSLATGTDLEEKAVEFSVTKGVTGIPFDDTYTNFNVSINEGVAKDYTVDINAPLIIQANAITITDTSGNQYSAAANVIIDPETFSGYIPINATSSITGGVAANTITNCDIDLSSVLNLDPTKIENIAFSCNNNKALTSPNPTVTDDQIKDESFRRINSMNNTNEDALTLALNKFGIFDITYKRDMFGYGTLGIVVKIDGNPLISDSTIIVLNNIISNITPFVRIVVPDVMVVKLTVRATYVEGTVIEDAKNSILSTIQTHFAQLDLGDPLQLGPLKDSVLALEEVDSFDIICTFVDDRAVLNVTQRILSDQIFALAEETPILYTA